MGNRQAIIVVTRRYMFCVVYDSLLQVHFEIFRIASSRECMLVRVCSVGPAGPPGPPGPSGERGERGHHGRDGTIQFFWLFDIEFQKDIDAW